MRKTLINCDCLNWLESPQPAKVRMVFADPPDNIGLGYNGFDDRSKPDEYHQLLYTLLEFGQLACDVLWLSFNSRHVPLVGALSHEFLRRHEDWEFKACVQTFTFGQHNKKDMGNNHRPLYRYMRKGTRLYPERVLVPSWRQLNGDKRAAEGGRVPGDVFIAKEAPQADMVREIQLLQRERDFAIELMNRQQTVAKTNSDGTRSNVDRVMWNPDGYWIDGELQGDILHEAIWNHVRGDGDDDVFDVPRVTGNSKQRRAFSPTQLNEILYERCVKLCCEPGSTVVDLFAGSGTLGRVAERCGVNVVMLEKSADTYANILADQPDVTEATLA